jgi:hypothetical protein
VRVCAGRGEGRIADVERRWALTDSVLPPADQPIVCFRWHKNSPWKLDARIGLAAVSCRRLLPARGATCVDRPRQLRGQAAGTVLERFLALFGDDGLPAQEAALKASPDRLRRAACYGVRWAPRRTVAAWHLWRAADYLNGDGR